MGNITNEIILICDPENKGDIMNDLIDDNSPLGLLNNYDLAQIRVPYKKEKKSHKRPYKFHP